MVKRILITGASGCIGHYVVETLLTETDHHLFLFVRDPDRLNLDLRPGVDIIQGDLGHIERHHDLLKTMDVAILIATSWGDPQATFNINVTKTVQLVQALDPDRCEQVLYFSTASILGRDNQPLKAAHELGTDYIRTKYIAFQQLQRLAIAPKITTLFPTLVLGGDDQKPKSHISSGLDHISRWSTFARFLKVETKFHFIHGQDIGIVVSALVEQPPVAGESRQLVLGNAALSASELIAEICAYFKQRIYFRFPLTPGMANVLIRILNIQMAPWDRFCMEYGDFTYTQPVSPQTFGRTTIYPSMTAVLQEFETFQSP